MKVEVFPTGPIMVNTYLAYDDNGNAFVVDPGRSKSESAEGNRN